MFWRSGWFALSDHLGYRCFVKSALINFAPRFWVYRVQLLLYPSLLSKQLFVLASLEFRLLSLVSWDY